MNRTNWFSVQLKKPSILQSESIQNFTAICFQLVFKRDVIVILKKSWSVYDSTFWITYVLAQKVLMFSSVWTTTKKCRLSNKKYEYINVPLHNNISKICSLHTAEKSFSTMYLLQSVKKTGWLICKIF